MPLLILLALEGGARLWSAPEADSEDPFLGFTGQRPLFEPDPVAPDTLITARGKRRWFNAERFPREKGPTTTRIFCLGGSTVYGHPYDAAVAFPRGLGVILDHAEPSRRHEVLNCGGISYASYRLTHIAEEVARYDPDAIVVLTGHNEFLERRSYPDLVDGRSGVLRIRRVLAGSRLYTLLRNRVVSMRDLAGNGKGERDRLGPEVVAALDRSAGLDLYHRDEHFREGALIHFDHNLRSLVEMARTAGARIVLVTPASNLADFSPFKSEHGEGLSAEEVAACEVAVAGARESLDRGKTSAAMEALEAVDDLDCAELQYARGRALRAEGRFDDADEAFFAAREADVAPLRAPAAFVDAVRRVAAELEVPLVDPVAALADSARRSAKLSSPGERYFLDHVHPRAEIHRMIAEGAAAALVGERVVRPEVKDWTPAASRPVYRERILDRIDPLAAARCDLNLAKTLSWAGKQAEARPFALAAAKMLTHDADAQYTAGVAQLFAGEEAESLFRGALEIDPGHARARSNLGALLAKRGESEAAMAELRRAARDDTTHVSSLLSLASILRERGRSRQAVEVLLEAVERDPTDPVTRGGLGGLYLQMGLFDRALFELQEAVERAPGNAASRNNLGMALCAAERFEEAVRAYERSLEIEPNDARVLVNLAIALNHVGEEARVLDLLDRAEKLRPGDSLIGRVREEIGIGEGR